MRNYRDRKFYFLNLHDATNTSRKRGMHDLVLLIRYSS